MKKVILAAGALAAVAGSATAGGISATANGPMITSYEVFRGTTETILAIDVTGVESIDAYQALNNTILEVDLGAMLGGGMLPADFAMTSVGWDVTIESVGASWLSEAAIYFDDNIAPDGTGLHLRPGVADNVAGFGAYDSAGQLDLSDNGIANILLPNGVLRMEFYETFDDVAGATDAIWGGTIYVGVNAVPAPGAAALMGLAGVAGLRRRR